MGALRVRGLKERGIRPGYLRRLATPNTAVVNMPEAAQGNRMRREYPDSRDGEVFVEQVRYVYSNAPRSIPFNVINPLILLLLFWPFAEHAPLVSWVAAMTLISAIRMLHVRRVLSREVSAAHSETLSRRFMIGSTATALTWSTGFVSIGLSLPTAYLTLFLLVLGGMAAGAFTSLGTHRLAYLLFLAGLFIPTLATLVLQGTRLTATMSVFVVLFIVMLALTHRVTYGMLVKGIRDTMEKEHLVKQLERANSRLEMANSELGTRADTDALTGIANRRHFEQRLTLEWQRARREKRSIACIMIDVDWFKQFNDRYGHAAGDECLKRVAETLDENVKRATDVVSRYGGEEFVVLLPDTSLEGARAIAERLNAAVAELRIPHEARPETGRVTISAGVAAARPKRLSDKHALVSAADEALYGAKNRGRNCVLAASSPEEQ